ncbi:MULTISPECIES: ASCH domain-containing protein [unclassified Sphingomonas]|uniref:ASCH domain-containing protein n=1 Tax=unclassified Sphingomonas TaxID=196159 RepID=UPI00138F8393|nr:MULTISPECIES: ASCH domain-containing protein [unclassified Sphingomonas]
MKALSLWQPWASAVALGHKQIETRHWSTRYRGPIAVHAAKRWTKDERWYADCFADIYACPALRDPPLGMIVAVAELRSVARTEDLVGTITRKEDALGNFGPGRFGWTLANVVPLDNPIAARGMQGLFDLPVDLSHAVRAAIL